MVNTMNSKKSGLKKIGPLALAALATFAQPAYTQEAEQDQLPDVVPGIESSEGFSIESQSVFPTQDTEEAERRTPQQNTTLQDIINATEYEPLSTPEEVFAVMGLPEQYSDRSHALELGITQSLFGIPQTFKLDEATFALYNEMYEMITVDNRISALETDQEFYSHLGTLVGKDLSGEPTAQSDHVMELVSLYHYFLERGDLERQDIKTHWTPELKVLYQDMLRDLNAEQFNIRRESEQPDQSPYDVIVQKQDLTFGEVYDRLAPYFQNTVTFAEQRNGEYGFAVRDGTQPTTETISLLEGSGSAYRSGSEPEQQRPQQTLEQAADNETVPYLPQSTESSVLRDRATTVLGMNRVELQRYLVEVPYDAKREVIEDFIGVDSDEGLTPSYFTQIAQFQEQHNTRIQDGTITRDNIDRMTDLAIQENLDRYVHLLSSYLQNQNTNE